MKKILVYFIFIVITSCRKDDLMPINTKQNTEIDSIKSVKLSYLVDKLPVSKIKKKKRRFRKLKFKKGNYANRS